MLYQLVFLNALQLFQLGILFHISGQIAGIGA